MTDPALPARRERESAIESCLALLSFNDNDLVRDAKAELRELRDAGIVCSCAKRRWISIRAEGVWYFRHADTGLDLGPFYDSPNGAPRLTDEGDNILGSPGPSGVGSGAYEDPDALLHAGRALGLLSSGDDLESLALVSSLVYPSNLVYPNEVFFDETGANQEPVFMWCGYFANMHYWTAFSRKWREVLAEPPALPFWHMGAARSPKPKPPFDALTPTQLREKEEKLASLLNWVELKGEAGCAAIVVRLPRIYHNQIVKGKITWGSTLTKRERKGIYIDQLEREHTIAFRWATIAALELAAQHKVGSVVNFIFDQRPNDPYEKHVSEGFSIARSMLPLKLGARMGDLTFSPMSSGKHIPLQAADMLAWHLGKRSWRNTCAAGDDPMWKYIDRGPINEIKLGVDNLNWYVDVWNGRGAPNDPNDPDESTSSASASSE